MKRSFHQPTNKLNKQQQKRIKLFSKSNPMSNESQSFNNKRIRYNNEQIDNSNATTSKSTGYNTFAHVSNSNTNGSKTIRDNYARVTKSIYEHYTNKSQSFETYNKKLELKEALNQIFREIFPYLGIYIVGSSANGFGTNQSDVDICLMVSHEELNQKTEAICLLKLIARAMRKAAFIRNLQVISAKVPIIKFHDSLNSIDCDININNHIGIRNTHLLKHYSDTDWRAKPLILSIKNWAKYHNINDASKQTLSSYSLALMAIYYMQTLKPPVLPVWQTLRPDKFDIKIDIRTLRLNDDACTWTSSNTQTLGELFVGFLEFYSSFDFESHVISVRTGSLIPKYALPSNAIDSNTQWKFILIEEPFDLSNTARAVFEWSVFLEIKEVFLKSLKIIKDSKSYDQLFTEKYYIDDYNGSRLYRFS